MKKNELLTHVTIWMKLKGVVLRNHHRDLPGAPVVKSPHFSAVGLGSIPGQGTRSHMLQLRFRMLQLKLLCAANNTWCSQITLRKNYKTLVLYDFSLYETLKRKKKKKHISSCQVSGVRGGECL